MVWRNGVVRLLLGADFEALVLQRRYRVGRNLAADVGHPEFARLAADHVDRQGHDHGQNGQNRRGSQPPADRSASASGATGVVEGRGSSGIRACVRPRRRHHHGALGMGQHLGRLGLLAAVHSDQIRAHLGSGLIAIIRIFGQRFEHDGIKLRRDARVPLRRRYRVLPHMLVGDCDRGVADERRFAGEHFVENAPQRVHVRACIDRISARLLRGKILGGADYCRCPRDAVVAVGQRTGDPEVHHLHCTGLGDHDVGRLDVAVDDPVLVAEVERLARVGDHLQGPTGRHRSVGVDDVAQGDPVDVLHHDVGQRSAGSLGFPGVVDGDDRGVVQGGGVLRLAAKP